MLGRALGLVLLLLSAFAVAQPVYNRYPNSTNYAISSGSAVLAGASFFIQRSVQPLSLSELSLLEQQQFTGLQGWSTRQWSVPAAHSSDVFLLGSAVLPAAVFLFEDGRKEAHRHVHMYAQTAFLNYAVTSLTKSLVKRNRPFVYNVEAPLSTRLQPDARMSFFSGHTSTVASFSFFTASVVSRYTDRAGVRWAAWSTAALLPAITGYLRMRAGKHYLSDVVVGYAAGAAIGIGVPLVHRRAAVHR
jgi:membrane-associated phospholipid phosphatase